MKCGEAEAGRFRERGDVSWFVRRVAKDGRERDALIPKDIVQFDKFGTVSGAGRAAGREEDEHGCLRIPARLRERPLGFFRHIRQYEIRHLSAYRSGGLGSRSLICRENGE